MESENKIRLQKYIALSGIASRRKAEELILEGRVKVNDEIVNILGEKVNPETDIVQVDGKAIHIEKSKVYVLLNKPFGYVTTASDQFDRPTVLDLVKNDFNERIYPVGRLDYDTEGLLLLTNDGDLTYKITHPKYNIKKVYIAAVNGVPNGMKLNEFRKGLQIEDYITSPAEIEIIKKTRAGSELRIIIHEGRNRQVRKMCEKIGHTVIKLKRVALGDLVLGELSAGQWRHLTKEEI
ncbi:MAG: pseudouridine synthase, partial [Clostridia bacterium]